VLEDERLQLSGDPFTFVQNTLVIVSISINYCNQEETHLVVNGSSSTLDGTVGTKVKVKLERMSATRLNKSARDGVPVPVALSILGEESNVVSLSGNNDRELGDDLAANLAEALLHITNLFLKNGGILAFGDT
jgi:hypothetical protein